MEVEPGVDLGLPVHQGEGEAHSVLDPITAPDVGAEATVLVRDHEVTLRPCWVPGGELDDQALNLLAFQVAVLGDELPAGPGAGHRHRNFVGAVLALEKAGERGGLNRLLTRPVAAVGRKQIFRSTLVLPLIVVDVNAQF